MERVTCITSIMFEPAENPSLAVLRITFLLYKNFVLGTDPAVCANTRKMSTLVPDYRDRSDNVSLPAELIGKGVSDVRFEPLPTWLRVGCPSEAVQLV